MSGLAERLRQVDDRVWDRALVARPLHLMVALGPGLERARGPAGAEPVGGPRDDAAAAGEAHDTRSPRLTAGAAMARRSSSRSSRPPPELGPAVFVIIAYAYSTGVHADGACCRAGLAITSGTILIVGIVDTPDDILFPFFVFGVAPWAIGRAIRTQTRARPRAGRAGGQGPAPARAGGSQRGGVRARPHRARPPRRARPQPERHGRPGIRRSARARHGSRRGDRRRGADRAKRPRRAGRASPPVRHRAARRGRGA